MGISNEEFWTLTPYLLGLATEGYSIENDRNHTHYVWLIWHLAAMTRAKKLGKLSDYLPAPKKVSKTIDENDIINRLKIHNEKVANAKGN